MRTRKGKYSKDIVEKAETDLTVEKIINKQLHAEIEQRRRLEKELKISEVRFRRLFETAQDGILILDFETGQIAEVNPFLMSMLDYPREYFLGKNLWEIGAFKDIKASKSIFEELQSKGFVRYENLPLVAKNGKTIEVEFVSNAYTVDHKKVIQCNIRDITDRARLKRIREGIERKVYYEIRNPLSMVKDGLDLIAREKAGAVSSKQKRILHVIDNAIERLIWIATELIDFAKLEEGAIELKRGPVNVQNLVKEAVSFFEVSAKNKGLEIRSRLPKKTIVIHADKDKIFQILSNLISNAIRFTKKGYIEIAVRETEGYVEFSVLDTGRGISGNDLPKIFGKLEQYEEAPKRRGNGVGLGLAIAKDIVELSKGEIWVESELDKGSKFCFVIPKAQPLR